MICPANWAISTDGILINKNLYMFTPLGDRHLVLPGNSLTQALVACPPVPLKAEEYSAAPFTVTNLGMYHVESFTAIIVPPQVAILADGASEARPALRGGELYTEHRMAFTLSGDHRVTDGAEGARFLGEIVSCLQDPARLFTYPSVTVRTIPACRGRARPPRAPPG